MSIHLFERELIRMTEEKLIEFLMFNNLIDRGKLCQICGLNLEKKNYFKVKEGVAWECTNPTCFQYRKKISIKKGSFFEGFRLPFLDIIQILLKWANDQPQQSIIEAMEIHHITFKKIISKFFNLVKQYDNNNTVKLGGPGKIVQADETALNHKIKAHRGRAPLNKTDALCIVEYDSCITKAFACVIANKKADTIIPIICQNVESGSTIWTDEHKSYGSLNSIGYVHDTVCHKYEFINRETGVNTQAVESFNNELNLEIKRRKGVATNLRSEFINEFVWKFNNNEKRFLKIWELLKIRKNN